MKETVKVSIGGYAFSLTKDAAAAADAYIKEMEGYYDNPEITDGIEERMAELLRERCPEGTVVEKSSVLGIIDILGRPESIAKYQPEDEAEQPKPKRKLYRDMDNVKLAGVCSGIAAYFKFDPVILRVAFVVLTLAGLFTFSDKSTTIVLGAPLAYIILWICIPPAKSARQRWEMRGEDGSAESIRRNVESNPGKVGSALKQVGQSESWGVIWRIFEVIIGIILLLVSVSGLFAGALVVLGWQWLGLGTELSNLLIDITSDYPQAAIITNTLWVKILGAVVYVLPFIGMLYGSIMLLFRIKSPSWRPGLVIFVLWLISLVAFGILCVACLASAAAL